MAMKKHSKAVGIAVLLSLLVFTNIVECDHDVVKLPEVELAALQDLLAAWNQTVDLNSSLPGWIKFNATNTTEDPCYLSSWRGVFCYIALNVTASAERYDGRLFDSTVVGLTLSDASIVGTLPGTVWDFNKMLSLTLTENPGLSGSIPPLPISLEGNIGNLDGGWTLKSLDLHGNAFDGQLTELLFVYYSSIEDLDLSNNRLDGPLPASLGQNQHLRTLKVSNNSLSGSIPFNFSGNWTSLVTADLSSNNFSGNIPTFYSASSLHTLNVSHNKFDGQIDLANVFSSETYESLAILDLSDNRFTGPMPILGAWSTLQSLNLSYNTFDEGVFPLWLPYLESLETLALSNSSLTGELNLSMFCNFFWLSTVELDDNSMTGALDIDSLMRCNGSLPTISLTNNKIKKVISSVPSVFDLPISLNLTGNPYCNSKATNIDVQRCLCKPLGCYDTNDMKANEGIIIGSAVGGSLGAVMMIIAAVLFGRIKEIDKFAEYEMKPTLFAYSELERATQNFHPNMKLGEGAFGAVYKGKLADDTEVAVKQLRTDLQQSMDDFLNEVIVLTSVKHRNLVKLKGYGLRGDRRLLVYEYLDNFDLAEVLFEHKGDQLVSWRARFNICLGVAQGLHYLHAGIEPRILHRDIKASNILLDRNLHPKIADFGLALLFPNEKTHITIMQIAGTKGYLAPEYATQGQLSDKVDVFSFGVLALEVVSGRKNISFDVPHDETYLIQWAWKLNEEGKLMDLVDPTLSIQDDEQVVVGRVLATILACLQSIPERRPNMAQVVGMLQGDIEIGESIRGQINENVIQTYYGLLNLNNARTTLTTVDEDKLTSVPIDVETQALYLGESSSSGNTTWRAFEMSSIRER